jgi:hypothetical protein
MGTSLERIAAESLTRPLSEFVHRDIWRCHLAATQDQVVGRIRYHRNSRLFR